MAQWIDGRCAAEVENCIIVQEPADKWAYEDQPHEIEARENEQILYDLWMMDKQPVSFFPNRLTA